MGKWEKTDERLKKAGSQSRGPDAADLQEAALRVALKNSVAFSAGTFVRKEERSLDSMLAPVTDWARKEIDCARAFNFELPEDLTRAVELLEGAVQSIMSVGQAIILIFDETSGVYTCLNDIRFADRKPRELTCLSDRFLQELLGSEEVIHTYLMLGGNLVGIVAIADKADGQPFNTQDELVLDLLAPYLATKVSAFKTLQHSLVLPYIQGQVLEMAGRLITAVDQESIFREALLTFGNQLRFDACQYVNLVRPVKKGRDKHAEPELYGEVLYEKLNGQVVSYTHAGLESKRKKIRDFSSLVALLTSIARKDPYLHLNGHMLGDKALSEIFGVKNVQSALILPVFDVATGQVRGTFNLFQIQPRLLAPEQLAVAREGAVLVSQALSRAQVLEKALAMASTDELTGLTNRRGFYERFEAEVERARRQKSEMTVALIDVDYFKRFNDTYGHLCGDLILKSLAELFALNVRKSDMVCRFGGEEFAILLPDTGLQAATDLLERVRAKVERMEVKGLNGETLKVTISAGVSSVSVAGQGDPGREVISESLAAADERLYLAKERGRNQVC